MNENNLNQIPPEPQICTDKLNPFGKFCVTIGMIPSSYKDSMTYEEQLLWFCNYLQNTVIPAVNQNAEATKELQELYTQLKNYVDNYFTNLDVQNEINTKLDQMAEDGTLNEIFKNKERNYIFIGDSYGVTTSRGSWIDDVIKYMNLTLNLNAYKSAEGSCGFIGDPNITDRNVTFINLLNNIANNIPNKNIITDIIIGGGTNDTTYSIEKITNAISDFMTRAKELFPNALISLGFIGFAKNKNYLDEYPKTISAYQNISNFPNGAYITGSETCWHYRGWLVDDVHPNPSGELSIANCIMNYIRGGISCNRISQPIDSSLSSSDFKLSSSLMKTTLLGNMVNIELSLFLQVLNGVTKNYTFNGNWLKIANFENTWISGGSNNSNKVSVLFLKNDNSTQTFQMDIKLDSGAIYIRGYEKENNTTDDLSIDFKTLIVNRTNFNVSAIGN